MSNQDQFLEQTFWALLKQAFKQGALINLLPDHELILEVIRRHDCVFAMWIDETSPSGFMTLSVSGFANVSRKEQVSMTAIPCYSREAALALQARYGGPADIVLNSPQQPAARAN